MGHFRETENKGVTTLSFGMCANLFIILLKTAQLISVSNQPQTGHSHKDGSIELSAFASRASAKRFEWRDSVFYRCS